MLRLTGFCASSSGSPGADGTAPFDTRQEGLYTTAAVVLDGAVLFRVATTGRGDLTAATRALTVDAALQQIVATDPDTGAPAYDPATLGVRVQRGHDRDSIEVADARHATP